MKIFRIIVLLSICSMLLIVSVVSRFVWLPDVITGRVIVLSRISSARGENMRLVQFFNGDGYLTEFIHTDGTGHRWSIVIDPDAKKAWRGSLTLATSNVVTIGIWDRTFSYSIDSHAVTGLRSQTFKAYEVPQGAIIDPLR